MIASRPAAQQIADFLAGSETSAPDIAIAAAQLILLNGLRATLAARDESLVRRLVAARPQAKPANDGALMMWSGLQASSEHAAICNQVMWSLLLMDDLEMTSGMHPGGPAAIAALIRSQNRKVSGRRLLAAIVAGIEVQIAVALASSPEMLQERGFAPLSVLAPLGAAAAGAVVEGISGAVAAHAVGIAAMSGAGMWEMGGTSSATFLTARGTSSGLAALEAAALGVEAPERALDGQFGAYRAYTGKPVEVLHRHLAELGSVWRTTDVLVQPYSGDTYSQAPLEAVAQILSQGLIDGATVESVRVDVNERAALGVTRKTARHPVLRDPLAFNSDPPARVAAALLRGSYSWDDSFARLVTDPEVAALRGKTMFVADPTVADIASAAVEVRLVSGEVRRARIDGFTGSAANPYSFKGMAEAFRDVADSRIGPDRSGRVVDLVAALPEASDVGSLLMHLA